MLVVLSEHLELAALVENVTYLWYCYILHSQVLLDGGADPNIAGEHGTTPLHCASRLGCTKVVRLLLNAGADVNARDDEDLSPLDVCPEEETLRTLSSHINDSESKNMPVSLSLSLTFLLGFTFEVY